MEAEGRYTFVGAVVLVVLAALIVAGVWLSGGADRVAYRHFTIYFTQQSMDGLAIGSSVKMRGIKVGSVDSFHFDEGGAVRVVVRIDSDVPVRTSAQAWVKRSLVTGLASIEVGNKNAEAPALAEVPKGERYPVISEGTSEIDKVATTVSRLAESGAILLERMNDLLSDENRRSLSGTLTHLDRMTAHLDDSRRTFDDALRGIRDASGEFRGAGESIARAADRAADTITGLGERGDTALGQVAQTLMALQEATGRISDRVDALSESGGLEFIQTGREVRAGAQALVGVDRTVTNARTLLFAPPVGELGPGESLK